jgi:hypothetical protein
VAESGRELMEASPFRKDLERKFLGEDEQAAEECTEEEGGF